MALVVGVTKGNDVVSGRVEVTNDGAKGVGEETVKFGVAEANTAALADVAEM